MLYSDFVDSLDGVDMRYYNAIEASRALNISDKTIRRWVKNGKIVAKRTKFNEIAIPESEIDKLRLELGSDEEWVDSPDTTDSIDKLDSLDANFEVYSKSVDAHSSQISKLTERVKRLEALIENHEMQHTESRRRLNDLEAHLEQVRLAIESIPRPSVPVSSMDETAQPQVKPSSPRTIDSGLIPDDWVLCSDFFMSHGIKETSWRRWVKDGIAGDHFECEEKPLPNGKTLRYFTPNQQQKALDLLKKHGKLP